MQLQDFHYALKFLIVESTCINIVQYFSIIGMDHYTKTSFQAGEDISQFFFMENQVPLHPCRLKRIVRHLQMRFSCNFIINDLLIRFHIKCLR